MTRHGLLRKGLTSADYNTNFNALIKKRPNLGYADVKLDF